MYSAIGSLTAKDHQRRASRDIQAVILNCLLKGNASLFKITTFANLNRDTALLYLERMMASGLVQVISESKRHRGYSATEKGKDWLKIYKNLLDKEGSNGKIV